MARSNQPESRLNRREIQLITLLLLFALLAGYYVIKNYSKAFPEYSIDFKVDRPAAMRLATSFFATYGENPTGFHQAATFAIDQDTKTFLERLRDSTATPQKLQSRLPVWYWRVRWFKPLSPEEYYLSVSPAGKIIAYEHRVPEAKGAPQLSLTQARRLGHQFIQSIPQINLKDWQLREQRSERLPNRTDYHFIFQKKGFEIAGATERIEITIQGNQVGAFRHFLKLPENWLRDYQRLRSRNQATALMAQALMLFILLAALMNFVKNFRDKTIDWRTASVWGAVTFLLSLLTQVNSLPLKLFDLDANQSLGNFYSNYIIAALFTSLGLGLLIVLILGASLPINGQLYPQQVAFSKVFTIRGLRTKHFFLSALVGLLIVPIFMAFQTFFYLTANLFGAWVPVEVGYSNVLNTTFPWFFVLFGGFAPAILEEGTFRLFAIPYGLKITRSRLLAILIPALIWGFAHANYPNQPFWIRGVEVGFFGILIGLIFLRINVTALLIWHYTVDAVYSALLLIRLGSRSNAILAGLCASIALLPFLYSLISYLRRGKFEQPDDLTYQHVTLTALTPPPQVSPTGETIRQYVGLPSPKRLKLVGLTVIIWLLAIFVPVKRPPQQQYHLSRAEALTIGRDFIAERQIAAQEWIWALDLITNYDELTGKYLLENTTYTRFVSFLQNDWQNSVVWKLRFCQPLAKEEWNLEINPSTGKVVAFDHVLPEDAPGSNLKLLAARTQTEKFLQTRGYDLTNFRLEQQERRRYKQRTDYTFSYESTPQSPFAIGEARLRLEVIIRGGEVARFYTTVKIPEAWRLKQTQQVTHQTLFFILKITILLLVLGWAIVLLMRQSPRRIKQLKRFLPVLIFLPLLGLITMVGEYRSSLLAYPTSWMLSTYQMVWIVVVIVRVTAMVLLGLLGYLVIAYCQPAIFARLEPPARYAYHLDAVIGSIVTASGFVLIGKLALLFRQSYYPPALAGEVRVPAVLASSIPLMATLNSIAIITLAILAGLALWAFLWQQIQWPVFVKFSLVLVLIAILTLPENLDWQEFLVDWLALSMLAVWFISCCRLILKSNYLAYIYTFGGFFILQQGTMLWRTQANTGKQTAILLISLMLMALIWNYWRMRGSTPKNTMPEKNDLSTA